MTARTVLTTSVLFAMSSLWCGCGIDRVFYRPSTSASVLALYDVVLATDRGVSEVGQPPPSDEQRDADRESSGQEQPPDGDAKDDKQASKRVPYTAPGVGGQRFSFMALSFAAVGTYNVGGSGREAAESAGSAGGAVNAPIGRPGLTSIQPTVARAVVGRPGLQQGFASLLGPVSKGRNIFTAVPNPLSGPTGRCRDLTNAGFFGSRSACESHFRR